MLCNVSEKARFTLSYQIFFGLIRPTGGHVVPIESIEINIIARATLRKNQLSRHKARNAFTHSGGCMVTHPFAQGRRPAPSRLHHIHDNNDNNNLVTHPPISTLILPRLSVRPSVRPGASVDAAPQGERGEGPGKGAHLPLPQVSPE